MKVVADENMPGLAALAKQVTLVRCPGRALGRAQLEGAQALLVRSVTSVDKALLAGTGVRFVGSGTIGTDHVDLPWLAANGITFAHAPGCNAAAVAEYVLQAALVWAAQRGRILAQCRIGVVGVGHVGSRVLALMQALGCEVLACDPPREQAGERLAQPWSRQDEVLAADVISLHVPLQRGGDWPTFHLLDGAALAPLHASQLLVNTCRGAVVDNRALSERLSRADAPGAVLDVWEGEPVVPAPLFARVMLGSPHVAGYSIEGKLRGSARVVEAFKAWAGLPRAAEAVPVQAGEYAGDVKDEAGLLALLQHRYRIRRDHDALSDVLSGPSPAAGFDLLRRDYPKRHEVAGLRVSGQVAPSFAPVLRLLGVGL